MAACTFCGVPAVVQWVRRPQATELAAVVAMVRGKHAERVKLSDPQLPPPAAPVLPTAADTTTAIYACADHGITANAASLVHASTCSAPPVCDCTPEQAPTAVPTPPGKGTRMPPGWQQQQQQ